MFYAEPAISVWHASRVMDHRSGSSLATGRVGEEKIDKITFDDKQTSWTDWQSVATKTSTTEDDSCRRRDVWDASVLSSAKKLIA